MRLPKVASCIHLARTSRILHAQVWIGPSTYKFSDRKKFLSANAMSPKISFYGSITMYYHTRFLQCEQEDQLHHERIRLECACSCSTSASTIALELEHHECIQWLGLALVLYRLRCFGLASSGSLVELLVEGTSMMTTEIIRLIHALTIFLVQSDHRSIPNAPG